MVAMEKENELLVKYFANFRDDAGIAEERVKPAPAVLSELLSDLEKRHPKLELIGEDGDLAPFLIVLIDGKNARLNGGLDALLPPKGEVAIFPPIAGG
jgi:MoaD family protein